MFKPNKKLGQNFLTNTKTIHKMINALEMGSDEMLVEIGPGLGAITHALVENFGYSETKIFAVELDHRFTAKLENIYKEKKLNNLKIIESNILEWLPKFDPDNKKFKIIGSLPYYITSPIVHQIIKMKKRPETCVLLIQKEVANKISAKAPDSSYLSAFVQTFYNTEYLGKVDKKDFSPSPKVDGGVIKMTRKKGGPRVRDIEKYEGFLHKAFSNPRKMLNKVFTEDERNRASVDGNLRAQNYNWEKWVDVFTVLQ